MVEGGRLSGACGAEDPAAVLVVVVLVVVVLVWSERVVF
jgi:hypothetical protein